MCDKVKIAAVQMDIKIMDNKANLEKILREAKIAAGKGADLVVFPECTLSGYVYTSREEAIPFMETVPGPATDRLADLCSDLGIYVVIGLLEIDAERCFNTAVLITPEGIGGKYRKNHLPFLGVDRYIDQGDQPFQVYPTPIGNIGLHICYDCNFPESARVMALLGADILILPTNWPEGRGRIARYVVNTRACENKVHFVAVNRVGKERGTGFIGSSKIVDAWGDTLAEAGSIDEEIIYADISIAEARQKRIVLKPGEFEMDFINGRRPELYGELTRVKR